MGVGIVIICTNSYFLLGLRFIKNFLQHYKGLFEIDFYIFTDTDPTPYFENKPNLHYYHTCHTTWIEATNSKFKNILCLKDLKSDYIYYFDADTNITADFTESLWFLGDLVGGEHYNNIYFNPDWTLKHKSYDRNPKSSAYIPFDTPLEQMYYLGSFFGGKREIVIEFCQKLYDNQCYNSTLKIEPIWNDESYINHYFHYKKPSRIILYSQFKFKTSDKGGLKTVHSIGPNIEQAKQALINNPEKLFKLVNGIPEFI